MLCRKTILSWRYTCVDRISNIKLRSFNSMDNKRGLSLIHSQRQLGSHFDNQKFTMQFSYLGNWQLRARTTDAQWNLFFIKIQNFWAWQTNSGVILIWDIFGQTISTHFGTVNSMSMFSIIQPLFLQKTKPLHPDFKHLFWIMIWIWSAKN